MLTTIPNISVIRAGNFDYCIEQNEHSIFLKQIVLRVHLQCLKLQ